MEKDKENYARLQIAFLSRSSTPPDCGRRAVPGWSCGAMPALGEAAFRHWTHHERGHTAARFTVGVGGGCATAVPTGVLGVEAICARGMVAWLPHEIVKFGNGWFSGRKICRSC